MAEINGLLVSCFSREKESSMVGKRSVSNPNRNYFDRAFIVIDHS